ncbi:caspase family protein [Chryseobacterium viscerum]|uniref:Caspase family protein n=1 Tax=Chryseobacterium viscerum TaxID=1037377 RepID=A0A5N4BSK0_9FLAO|nr:caspase family protein [Chryseobacterium viscerum]KAB1231413.1 caspase family protein [Chryseobacterium viscerum]
MNKHAILIGVNEVPQMDYLSTPRSYAIQMQQWAESQGYITHLFIDKPVEGIPSIECSRGPILEEISNIIEAGTDKIFIYFAGHGFEQTAGNDIWLLPGYIRDSSESISVFLNKVLAYTSGVPHIVFISDTCRSRSSDFNHRSILGNQIIPTLNRVNPRTEVDVLYSTWPGQVSTDIRIEDDNYRSIYSECLLECLHGRVHEVIRNITGIVPTFPAVLSYELNNYLKENVPRLMRDAGSKIQVPMGEVNSRDPYFLSRFGEQEQIDEVGIEYWSEETRPSRDTRNLDEKLDSLTKLKVGPSKSSIKKLVNSFKKDYQFYTMEDFFGRELTGLHVTGINEPLIFSRREVDWENATHDSSPRIFDFNDIDRGGGAIYIVGNRRGNRYYPINVIPGFFTQVVFEKGQVLTVNYFPTSGNAKYEARYYANEVAERKAQIIIAAKNGIFQGTRELAGYLRSYKQLDPTLGLFAAYAYFQKGDFAGVRSVYDFMLNDRQTIVGDIWLLNKLSLGVSQGNYYEEIPLPLLTEGWSYLKMLKDDPHEELSTQLQPGLWTSFNRIGFDYLYNEYNFRHI